MKKQFTGVLNEHRLAAMFSRFGYLAVGHLRDILKILLWDDYDEVITEYIRAYCQYHKLLDRDLDDRSLEMEMWKVSEILDQYNGMTNELEASE